MPSKINICFIKDSSNGANEYLLNESTGSSKELCYKLSSQFINRASLFDEKLKTYLVDKYCVCGGDSSHYQNESLHKHNYKSKIMNDDNSYENKFENISEPNNTIHNQLEESKSNSVHSSLFDDDHNLLISKSVEEVLNSKILNDAVKSCPHYGISKRRLYHLRPDVIIKVILRCMKKYYLKDFKAFFNFTKCKSDLNSDTSGELIQQINRYLNTKFGDSNLSNMTIYLISVLKIKAKFITISENNKELYQTINEIIYFFSKPKLTKLMKTPQFVTLLLTFLSKSDILRFVIKSQNDAEVIQAYSEQIQMLKNKCRMALNV